MNPDSFAYRAPDEPAPPLPYPWETVEPGEYDVSMEEYLSWPILSASLAKLLTQHEDRTPAYLHWVMHREIEESRRTGAAALGTLSHSFILEPETLDDEYIREPEPDPTIYTKADGTPSSNPKATKDWREMYATLEGTGKSIVTAEQWDDAKAMRDAVEAHETASALVTADGPIERSIVAHDPETGVLLKGRTDKLIPKLGYHVNLKTTVNASRESFTRDSYRYAYYLSMAFYERLLVGAGFPLRRSIFLAVENVGAHQVAVWEADDAFLDAGHKILDVVLPIVADCARDDVWPDHGSGIDSISLPNWAFSRVDDFLQTADWAY